MASVIGITGLAGAGKDTLALAMHKWFARQGEPSVLGGFADPLREISNCMGLDPYTRALKEHKHELAVDLFYDMLALSISRILRNRVPKTEQDMLYHLTIEHTQQFVSGGIIRISPREFMQILGTEAGQAIRKTFWVDLATSRWLQADGFVLVTDFRFDHEVRPLDQILCVVRPGVQRVNQHRSEDLADNLTKTRTPGPCMYQGKRLRYVDNDSSEGKFKTITAQQAAEYILLSRYL